MTDEKDLTSGNIVKTVITFAIPFLLANIIQALYGAVDLMVIGKYCTPDSVSAVSTGTQVTQIITSIISGLTLGGTVIVGRYAGMKREEDIKTTIGTNLTIFFIVGIILTVVMLVFVDNILTLLQTPKSAFDEAKEYVSVCACGIIFICGYNAISAILRGYGDSKSPLVFVFIAGCINIFGDILLVKYFNMGVKGTALATIFSQGISMVFAIIYLKNKNFIFDFKLSNFKISKDKLKSLAWVGIPVSFQECMVRLSFLYLTSVTNSLGVNASSAVGIASKYDVFAMLPATSVASALSAIVAQNYGAEKYDRMTKSLFIGILAALPFSLAFFGWAQISPESMIGIFSKDENIISVGIPFFKTCSFDYICVLFVFCMNGYLNGRSKTIFTMISCCFGALALRMPLIYIVCKYFPENLGVIGTVAPSVSFIMAVYTLVYVLYLAKNDKKIKL
ncbi:MATE family efflux transporter [Tyzzerella sp. An114]|uniref:MATE family efflux transporter n=1 Tax=Tyzzerella sp. An114 TaxID=1965545 RepID=UPI000B435EBB|nr:MATE family efflux transporter [Tyzzerella sp. An114]OUQ60360.1 MATE family efflux transporter [Tyzzerella sp. An114]